MATLKNAVSLFTFTMCKVVSKIDISVIDGVMVVGECVASSMDAPMGFGTADRKAYTNLE